MSRSYKRKPVYKDGSSGRRRIKKHDKRRASRKVRRTNTAFRKSNIYRRLSETWDICDYRTYEPFSYEYLEDKELLNWWKKWYYRK